MKLRMKYREIVLTALHLETLDRYRMQVDFAPEFAERFRTDMSLRKDGA
jgi:hypothetical protein